MFGLGMGEALILLAVVLLLFGGKKLPELGNSMGKALTNFKKGMKDNSDDTSASGNIENKKDS
jgi:sec-independent protein translocase protein TatA